MDVVFGEGCCDEDNDFIEALLEMRNYQELEKTGDLLIIDTVRAWHTISDTAVYIGRILTGEKNLPPREEYVRPYRYPGTNHRSLF